MEPTPAQTPDRRLLLAGALFGMLAIVALPLTQTAGVWVAEPLAFATPIVLVLSGAMRRSRLVLVVGAGIAVVLLALLVLDASGVPIGSAGWIVVLVLLAGPAVAVVAIGLPLRQADLVAGAAFLGGGTIAVIAGFATASVAGATSLVLGVGLVSLTAVTYRIGRRAQTSEG